jgi:glycosyltransferase involved in cell wall biosynthesis
VLSQIHQDYELIIVDDGSTDNTEETIQQINSKKIQYFKIQNSERGAARNFGVLKSSGEYVTFLDSDDILYPDYLSNALELIENNPEKCFLHLPYHVKTGNKTLTVKVKFPSHPKFLVKGNSLSCIGVFVNRDAFVKDKFNEDRSLAGSEDWELWMRLYSKYGLISGSKVSACLINHNSRSILNSKEQQLVKRKELAISSAFKDLDVIKLFSPFKRAINAYWDTYISLHLVLSGKKKRGIKYLLQAFMSYPLIVFERRFLAIIKHLIIK